MRYTIRDEVTDSGLDAPIGAMRRKARKDISRGKMHAQTYARPEVSTEFMWQRAGKANYNINLKAGGLGSTGFRESRRWPPCAEPIASFERRGCIFDAISKEGV